MDSNIKIPHEIRISENSKDYLFIPNEKGFLNSIRISLPIKKPEESFTKIEKGDEEVAAKMAVNYNKESRDELVYEFQKLESILAFSATANHGWLKKIHWGQPTIALMPENEKEKERVQISSFQYRREFPTEPILLTPTTLEKIVHTIDKYEVLTIPKSFFREGVNELHSFRYINAFYNFYFILEGFYYIEGKTKDRYICEQFKKDPEVRKVVGIAIDIVQNHPKQLLKIKGLLQEENLLLEIDGVIDLIIKYRGYLHHYFSPSSKPKPSPFNQDGFEDIALFAMLIANLAISAKIMAINTGKL